MHNNLELVDGRLEVEILLDVLRGCDNNCPGCFVSRQNKTTGEQLKAVLDFANVLTDNIDVSVEVFLGSTDLFTASNFEEIVTHPHFLALPSHNLFASSTLLSDPSVVEYRIKLLKTALSTWGYDGEFELFTILDLDKYLSRDTQYIKRITTNLAICNPDVTIFIVNYYSPTMFDPYSIGDIQAMVLNEFGAELKVIPSFFRSQKAELVLPRALGYKDLVSNIEGCTIDFVDRYVGPVPYANYCFTEGELYFISYMWDDFPQDSDMYHIPKVLGTYTLDGIAQAQDDIISTQLEYAPQTDECESCNHLMTCVSRNVLTYMEHRDIPTCMLPKELFDQYDRSSMAVTRH